MHKRVDTGVNRYSRRDYLGALFIFIILAIPIIIFVPMLIDSIYPPDKEPIPDLSIVNSIKIDTGYGCTSNYPVKTITDSSIVRQLVEYTQSKQGSWRLAIDAPCMYLSMTFYAGNNNIYSLGLGPDILLKNSGYFLNISEPEFKQLFTLIGENLP